MSEGKTMRLNKVLRELNISLDRAVEYLAGKGHEIEARPTTKISGDVYQVLLDGFQTDASKKAASKEVGEEKRKEKEAIRLELEAKLEKKRAEEAKKEEVLKAKAEKLEFKTVGKIDIDNLGDKKTSSKKDEEIVESVKEPKEATVVEEVVEKVVVKDEKPKSKAPISKIEKEASRVVEKPVTKKVGSSKNEEAQAEITPENAEAIKNSI